jgi:hypothetical protein
MYTKNIRCSSNFLAEVAEQKKNQKLTFLDPEFRWNHEPGRDNAFSPPDPSFVRPSFELTIGFRPLVGERLLYVAT